MSASEVTGVLEALELAGVAVRVDGGWGVDALCHEQLRPHDDGRPVCCLTPGLQMRAHAGYEVAERGREEIRILHERVGVEPPADGSWPGP